MWEGHHWMCSPKAWDSFFHLFHHQLCKDSCWHVVSEPLCSLTFLQTQLCSYLFNSVSVQHLLKYFIWKLLKSLTVLFLRFPPPPFFIVVKNTKHKNYHLNHFQAYSSVVLSISLCEQISRTFSSCQYETLDPLNNSTPLFPLSPALDNHHSTFCLYKFYYFIYLYFFLLRKICSELTSATRLPLLVCEPPPQHGHWQTSGVGRAWEPNLGCWSRESRT